MSKITDEMVTDFVRLHRQGTSYREIGRRYGVDYRTVGSWIHKAEREQQRGHWEFVSREVDARYLDEHYRLLLRFALGVLDVVQTDPLFARSDEEARGLYDRLMIFHMGRASELLAMRGIDFEDEATSYAPDRYGRSAKQRLCRQLNNSLMEHESELESSIEGWMTDWSQFQQVREECKNVAVGLFKQNDLASELSEVFGPDVVEDVLNWALSGADRRVIRIEERDGTDAVVVIEDTSSARELFTGPKSTLESVPKIYDAVFCQMSLEQRLREPKEVYERLYRSVSEVQDLVDELVLRGKPRGLCKLCTTLSATRPSV